MSSDSPLVEEIRARRMALSARFGHDPKRYFAYLQEVQKRYADRVVEQITVVPAATSKSGAPKPGESRLAG